MKNILILNIILIIASFNLMSQTESGVSFDIVDYSGLTVYINPVVPIDDSLITEYVWKFGDGEEFSLKDPISYTYSEPGTYKISFAITYYVCTGEGYNIDCTTFGTIPYEKYVTVPNTTSYGGSGTYPIHILTDPIEHTGPIHAMTNEGPFNPTLTFEEIIGHETGLFNYSVGFKTHVEDPNSIGYSFKYYVDGVKHYPNQAWDKGINETQAEWLSSISTGFHKLQLEIVRPSHGETSLEWSPSYDFYVKPQHSVLLCKPTKHAKASFSSIPAIIQEETNASVIIQVEDIASSSPGSIDRSSSNWTHNISARQIGGSPVRLDIIGSVVSDLPDQISLKINTSGLSPGIYAISDIMVDGDDHTDCDNCDPIEAIAVIEVEATLLLDKHDKVKNLSHTSPDYTQYSLTTNSDVQNYSIEISGPQNCDGTINVDGDWIKVSRFDNTALEISCEANSGEARDGNIIIKFPEISKEVTLNIQQEAQTFEVSDDKELKIAINEAVDGSTIILNEGVYNTPLFIIGKNVTLTSKFSTTGDPYYIDNTIIDAGNEGSVIKIAGSGESDGTTKIVGMHLTGGNSEKGGGIFCSNANLDLEHVLIHNSYGGKGGGIYASDAIINLNHVTITDNDSEIETENAYWTRKFGNLIYLRGGTRFYVKNSIIGSETDNFKGGIYYEDRPYISSPHTEMHISYSRVEGNHPFNESALCNILYIPDGYGYYYFADFKFMSHYQVRFEDPSNKDYWLNLRSVYRRKGDDGKDIGALFYTTPLIQGNKVVSFSPGSVSFDNTILGQSVTKEIEVTNLLDYKVSAKLTQYSFEEDTYYYDVDEPSPPLDYEDFSVIPDTLEFEKRETKKIYVTFNPQSFGSKEGRILFKTKSAPEIYEVPINGNSVTKPDLFGETDDNPAEFYSGQYIHGNGFLYRSINQGQTPSAPTNVKYYLSPVPLLNGNSVLLGEFEIPALQPGEYYRPITYKSLSIPQETQTGTYHLIAILDSENEIDEHNETNNELIKPVSVIYSEPVLTVNNVKILPPSYIFEQTGTVGVKPDEQFRMYFKVNNSSDFHPNFNTKIYLSNNSTYEPGNDIEITTIYNKTVSANSSVGIIENLTIPENTEPGGYFLIFRAYEEWFDSTSHLIPVTYYQIEVLQNPDYEIFWATKYIPAFYPGENYPANISLRNNGNSDAPATEVKFYLSTDPNYDASDIELGSKITNYFSFEEGYQLLEHNLTLPSEIEPTNWYIISVVDPDNLIEETNEVNNSYYVEIQIDYHPDLTISPLEINTNSVMAGSTVSVSGNVTNIDYGEAPESKLKFYLSEDEILHHSWDIELGEVIVSELTHQQNFSVTDLELQIPSETPGGNWNIIAKADGEASCPNSWCDIKESNEDNNIAIAPISIWRQPELSFGNISIRKENTIVNSFIEGTDIELGYEIWHTNGNMNVTGLNNGLSFAGDHLLTCYLSNDNILDTQSDLLLGSAILESSSGNEYISGSINMTLPDNMEGSQWFVIAQIDANNQVVERDETNNLWIQEITISEKPDLEIQSFTVTPNIAIQGVTNSLIFNSFIKNISPINKVAIASVNYYFSDDINLSNDDKLIRDTEAVLSDDLLNEGTAGYGSLWESETWSQGVTHGNYYLICETFPGNHAEESDTENNIVAIPFGIQQPADLDISNLTIDRTNIEEGSSFDISCTITNNNVTTSNPCILNFNLDVLDGSDFSTSNFTHTLESINLPALAQGESFVINNTYTVPLETTAFYFNALCDVEHRNIEANKVNNIESLPITIQPTYPPLVIEVIITPPSTHGGNNGNAYCNITGGIPPFSYQWFKSGVEINSDAILNYIEAGDYMVQITDVNGEAGNNHFVVTQPNALISNTVVVQHVSSHNGNDGIIEINIQDGNPPYHINCSNGYSEVWPPNQTSGIIENLSPGYLNVTITEDNTPVNGNSNTHSILINDQFHIAYNPTHCSQFGANDGAINIVNVSGAIAPLSYSWTHQGIEISTVEDLSNLSPGIYILTVTDNVNNIGTVEITITEPNELIVDFTVTDVSVTGQSDGGIDLTITSGNPPYAFNWQNGNTNEDVSNWPAGEHMVTITDTYHSVTKYITIGQPMGINASINHVTQYDGNNGSISSTAYGGTFPYTYTWFKDDLQYATGSAINNLTVGQYRLEAEDYFGNIVTKTYFITEPNPLVAIININDLSTFNSNDGSIEILIQNGNPPYHVTWDGNTEIWSLDKTSGTIENLSPGSAFITIREENSPMNGNEISQYITINNSMGFHSFQSNNVSQFGGSNGSIMINVQGGDAPYSYQWNKDGINYSLEEDLDNLSAGNYEVTVTDNSGKTISRSFTITQPEELIVNYTVINASSSNSSDGHINLTVTGNPPFTYEWGKSSNNNFSSSDEDLNSISSGTYTIDIVDNSGETYHQVINVQPLDIWYVVNHVKSNGGSDGLLNVGSYNGGGLNFIWEKDGEFFSNSHLLENISAGEYTVTVTGSTGLTNTLTILVTEPDIWLIDHTTTDVSTYNGTNGAIDISVSGGNPPFTFSWTNGNNTEDITGLSPGNYTINVHDKNGLPLSKNIEVKNPLTLHGGNKTNNSVSNGEDGAINSWCDGGYAPINAQIFKDGILDTSFTNLQEHNLISLNNLTSGEYFFVYTDANNTTQTRTFEITEPIAINLTSVVLSGPESNDASISTEITGGLPPYTYEWRKDNVFYSNEKNLSNLSAGMYSVTVTDVEGRTGNTIRNISVYQATVNVSGGDTLCGDSGEAVILLEFTGRPPFRSVVLNNGSTNFNLPNISTFSYEYRTNIPGTYSVTSGWDNLYVMGTMTGSATVVVNEIPTATLSGGGELCQNEYGIPLVFDFTGEAPWNITYTNGTLTFMEENITDSHFEIVTDLPGTYSLVSVNDANCTGTVSGGANITQIGLSFASMSLTDGLCSIDDNATISIELEGISPWNFAYSNGIDTQIVSGYTDSTYQIITSIPGTYYLTELSDATGCPGISLSSLELGMGTPPTGNITGGGNICEGETIDVAFNLTGLVPWNITYSNGINTFDIESWTDSLIIPVSEAGTYEIIALSDNMCTSTEFGSSAGVIINASPVVNLGQDTCLCEGTSIILDAGLGFTTYSWNGQPGSNQLEVTTAGVYSVEVIDNNGCLAIDSIEVSLNPLPVIELGPNITATQDAFIYLEAEPGYQNYEWCDNFTCPLIGISMQNVSTYTDIWLNVTDSNGCVGTDLIRLSLESPAQDIVSDEVSEDNLTDDILIDSDNNENEALGNKTEEVVSYKLFPNPTTGKLSISISDPTKVESIDIYDLKGNLVKSIDNISTNPVELDFTNYAKGAYLIKVNEGSRIKEFKIIRN